jgi:putative transposase
MRQDNDRRGGYVVAGLNVQLVFVTKHRREVLTGEHLGTLGEVFASVCADFGAELVELDGEDDPVTCSSPPRRTSRSPGW